MRERAQPAPIPTLDLMHVSDIGKQHSVTTVHTTLTIPGGHDTHETAPNRSTPQRIASSAHRTTVRPANPGSGSVS